MSLVNFTIPNLTNGVSQQPATIRLPNQGEEQINANCRVTDGLSKRQPVQLILSGQMLDDAFVPAPVAIADDDCKMHMMKGQDSSGNTIVVQLMVQCSSGFIWATFLEGPNAGETHFQGTSAYLAGSTKKDIKFLTNGDTTYIMNKNKVVATLGTATNDTATNRQGTLVYVQQGFFGTRYSLTVSIKLASDGSNVQTVTCFYSTADSTGTDLSSLQTSNIASALKSALDTAITAGGSVMASETVVTLSKNWFSIAFDNDTYAATHRIEVEAFSSTSRAAIFAFNGNVIDYLTLPSTAPEGYVVKVQADASTTKDDYYLRYAGKNSGWLESKRLGFADYVDNTTMPIQITGLLTGSEVGTVANIAISPREVGDIETVPEPSFVGNKLNDMFIFNNRFGFLSKNNVIMSKIDEFSVFYRTTVGATLSADRVDLQAAIPTTRYSDLNFSIPFDKELILFGDSAQYSLSANTGFDVKTASLATLTEYEASKDVAPINIGSSVYFPVVRGAYSAVFDLARRDNTGLTAEEATQHVPVYIKGSIIELVHSTTENMVFCRTDSEKKTIYVQNRFVRETKLEQNAWHKWTVPNDILMIYVLGSRLYVTMVADDGLVIHRTFIDISLSLVTQTEETEITFNPFVDYNKLLSIGAEVSTTAWVGTDYYIAPEHVANLIGIDSKGYITRGVTAINAKLVSEALWVGIPFTFSYTFSEQTPASYGQNGKTVMQYARLSLLSMKIAYSTTGKFDVKIQPAGRDSFITYFTGNILGLANSILGRINIYTGVFKAPINNRSNSVIISIESAQPYPCTFNTVEWQGKFTNNSGRM